MPILRQSRCTLHFRFVENQQHENFVRNIPFAPDSILVRRSESESRIVLRVALNDVAFLILPKRTAVHLTNRGNVIGTFFSDLNQHVNPFVSSLEKLEGPLKLINHKTENYHGTSTNRIETSPLIHHCRMGLRP